MPSLLLHRSRAGIQASRSNTRRSGPEGSLPAAALYEFQRLAKQLQILLVVGGIGPVDLDPLLRRRQAGGLERHDVVPREVHFPRDGDRQPQADTVAADAGEHAVAHEVGVPALDLSRAHSGQLEEYRVDLRLAWRRHQRSIV